VPHVQEPPALVAPVKDARFRVFRRKARLTAAATRIATFSRGSDLAVLANDWTRTCEVCGELQRLELRLVRGVVRDQPRCSACRHKRLGKRRPATGVDERQQGLFESRDGAGVDQTPDEAPTSPETPAALQAHPHLQQSQTPVPSQAPTCIMCGAVGTVDSLARFWSAPPGEVRPREHWRCLRHPFY
jgi:hypothetical protein